MCLLTVKRVSPGWFFRKRHRAECRACIAMLCVTHVIWFATGLPRACCKTDLVYNWINALSIRNLYVSQDTLASHARLTSFVQPLGRVRHASKGILHTRVKVSCIQFKNRQGNFRCARKDVSLILVSYYCVYIYL